MGCIIILDKICMFSSDLITLHYRKSVISMQLKRLFVGRSIKNNEINYHTTVMSCHDYKILFISKNIYYYKKKHDCFTKIKLDALYKNKLVQYLKLILYLKALYIYFLDLIYYT